MAEAANSNTVKSTDSRDITSQLASVLEEQIISMAAEQERKLAQTRTEATNAEIGTVAELPAYVTKPGERVLGTFGRTRVNNKNGTQIIETPEKVPERPIDVQKVTAAVVSGIPQFNIDDEFAKLKTISDYTQREDAAQLLFMNVGQQASVAQQRIRSIAAQRAGVNDAQSAFDKNIALDAAAVNAGRIRVGDTTIQTQQARQALTAALQAANALETDLIKQDPEIQKLNDYRTLLVREFQQVDRRQDKQAASEAVFGVMTDGRIRNAQLALKLPEATTKIVPQIHASLKKDKALQMVLDADKSQFARLMVDPDMKVRQYTYNIIAGMEMSHLGINKPEQLPDYIKALEPLIANREALISQARMANFSTRSKALLKEGQAAARKSVVSAAETKERNTALLASVLQSEMEDTARNKYADMTRWNMVNPQFKKVVEAVKLNTKDGRVLVTDGVAEVMKADLVNPDNTKMTPQQKISVLIESLGTSMDNDNGSALLPNAVSYKAELATQVKNDAMREYVRMMARQSTTPLDSNYQANIYEMLGSTEEARNLRNLGKTEPKPFKSQDPFQMGLHGTRG